jgi:hypothetical protein
MISTRIRMQTFPGSSSESKLMLNLVRFRTWTQIKFFIVCFNVEVFTIDSFDMI